MNLALEFHPVPKPSKSVKERKPMTQRRTSKSRSKEFSPATKSIVRERSGNKCERCKRRRLMHFHHCHFRSEGNACTNELKNCLGMCLWCHTEDDDSAHKSPETRQWCIEESERLARGHVS